MTELMLIKNTNKLRQEVNQHIAADSIVQRIYWDSENSQGCFIGCLAHSNSPEINETTYGLPVIVQRIAESIFEGLAANEAKKFFAALPGAVSCDGKDLSKVGWQFLAAELRALPKQPNKIQAVIDPVIAGMDLLAEGKHWLSAAADADAAAAAWAADAAAVAAACAADDAAAAAAWAAGANARAADAAAAAAAVWSAAAAARAAAAWSAVDAWAATNAAAAVRLRQRDLLLRLISEAPVVGVGND